jgi:hypothetical protein
MVPILLEGEAMSYPVNFEADYVEPRNRVSAFFRMFLTIPLLVVGLFYAFAAELAIAGAWFAIVFTGRYPDGLYNFVAGFLRFGTRANGYALLLCDEYPPFSGEEGGGYPIRLQIGAPLPAYSRVKTLFRIVLAIPVAVLRYIATLLMEVTAFAAWFVILFTGRMPRGLYDAMVQANAYIARSDAYLFLLTETYPPFSERAASGLAVSGQQ